MDATLDAPGPVCGPSPIPRRPSSAELLVKPAPHPIIINVNISTTPRAYPFIPWQLFSKPFHFHGRLHSQPSSLPAPTSRAMPGLVTATGVLGFLSDEEPELKVFALQTLNDDIDTVWTEVAGALSQMYAVLLPIFSVVVA